MAKDREGRALSKPARKGSANHLSEEERILWEQAARSLQPLKKKKHRVHVAEESAPGALARRPIEPEKPETGRLRRTPELRPAKLAPPATSPPPLLQLDRRKSRQIGSGKIEIEARIDLHGMRQSEAHAELRRFLLQAHARDKRWVLVITGKGGPSRRSVEEGEYAGQRDEGERGVLKRNVPRWLAEPELRAIVVSYAPAVIRHGGEGALYVQLRKRSRPDLER